MKKARSLFFAIVAVAGIMVQPAAAAGELELGTEVYYYNYEEPDFMEDTGVFFGINGSYTAPVTEDGRAKLGLEGRVAWGWVDYTSDTTGDLDDIEDFVFETRGLGGYDFDLDGEGTGIMPYLGIGYRYLNDDSSGELTTTGAAGYERESNYLYLPIGADLHGPINDEWSYNFNAEFDVFLWGEQESNLGDAIPGLDSVTNEQDDGWGARGSMRLTKTGEKTVFSIEPFVRYWHIDDSEISAVTVGGVLVGYGLEPENNTLEAGVNLALKF